MSSESRGWFERQRHRSAVLHSPGALFVFVNLAIVTMVVAPCDTTASLRRDAPRQQERPAGARLGLLQPGSKWFALGGMGSSLFIRTALAKCASLWNRIFGARRLSEPRQRDKQYRMRHNHKPSRHYHWPRYKHSAMRESFSWVFAQWRLDCSEPLRTWIVLA